MVNDVHAKSRFLNYVLEAAAPISSPLCWAADPSLLIVEVGGWEAQDRIPGGGREEMPMATEAAAAVQDCW